jgi:hypothetical protein
MLFGGAPYLAGGPRGAARAQGGDGQGRAVQIARMKTRVESAAPGFSA